MKKIIALILTFALCFSAVPTVYAANESNELGVTFSATLDKETLQSCGSKQQVVLTVVASTPISTSSVSYATAISPSTGGLTISALEGDGVNVTGATVNLAKGEFAWSSSGGVAIDVKTVAKVTVEVPANIPAGQYQIGVTEIELSNNFGMTIIESTAEAYATLTINAAHTHKYDKETKEPTCEEKGYTTYQCSCGDSYVSDYVPAKGHTVGNGVVENEVAPDCKNAGSYDKVVYCSVCDKELSRKSATVDALGHTEKTIAGKAATCTATGLTEGKKCSVCGTVTVEREVIPAHGHKWDEGKVTTEPTYEKNGVKTYTCEYDAKHTKTENIPAKQHNYTGVVTAPTCENQGYTTYTCSSCGDSYVSDYVDAHGHKWDEGKVTTEPTYEKNGVKTYTCEYDAKHTKTETIPAKQHNYTGVVTAPTCEDQGYTTYTCSSCGDSYVSNYVDAHGHKWDEGKVTTEPTYEKNGVKTYTCEYDAKHTKTETIPAKQHNYTGVVTAPTCEDQGYTTYTCSSCGDSYVSDYVPAKGHAVIAIPGKDATCTATGLTEGKKCSVCGAVTVEQEVIPATNHDWSTWTATDATNHKRICENNASHVETAAHTYSNDSTCDVCGYTKSSSGGTGGAAGGGASSPSVSTETTKNEDGSTTVTETKQDGTVVETTTNTDGSSTKTETKTETSTSWNGTTTTTTTKTESTDASGNVVTEDTVEKTVEKKDGSAVTTTTTTTKDSSTGTTVTSNTVETTKVAADGSKVTTSTNETKSSDGSKSTTTVDANGKSETNVTVSATAVKNADKSDAAVTLPMPAVSATDESESAPVVEISVPAATKTVTVEIPVAEVSAGTVVVLVHDDGTEEVVRKTNLTEDGLEVKLEGSATVKVVDNSKTFTDVAEDAWYADGVAFASSRELYNGVGDDKFDPDGDMTRGMLATVLHRLEDEMEQHYDGSYFDALEGHWATEGIYWASECKIVEGYGDGNYGTNDNITREQMITMVYRYLCWLGVDTSVRGDLTEFSDCGKVHSWAEEAMQWAVGAGVINGVGNNLLNPEGSATRAQVAVFMQRITGLMF